MKRKQPIALLLLFAMLAATACGGESNDTPNNDTTPANGDDTTPVVEGYDYQDKDFGGYELNVLNLDVQYGCYIRLDFDEQTGEKLDDAVYNRNRFVEDKLNFNLNEVILPRGSEWQTGQEAVCEALMQQVMADDDDYDAAFLPVIYKRDVLADNYILNLRDIPELKLDEYYWDSTLNKELTIKDTLYTASGPLNLMTMDMCWVLLFNQDMMDDLKLEYPYQLVRDEKWTIDKMNEYIAAGANLNGDENFRFNENGNAVYGLTGHAATPQAMLYGAGITQYEYDNAGDIQLTLGGENVYVALEKLETGLQMANGFAHLNSGGLDSTNGYLAVFNAGRALFFGGQLKSAMELRAMEDTFGMLPMPKLDETQQNYLSLVGAGSELLVIPTTQDDTARAGFILDALTYESYERVRPVYNDVTVSQKGLRNDDSIDMLEYVWNNRSINMLSFYNIDTLTGSLASLVTEGKTDTASSLIASKESEAQQKLADFLASLD